MAVSLTFLGFGVPIWYVRIYIYIYIQCVIIYIYNTCILLIWRCLMVGCWTPTFAAFEASSHLPSLWSWIELGAMRTVGRSRISLLLSHNKNTIKIPWSVYICLSHARFIFNITIYNNHNDLKPSNSEMKPDMTRKISLDFPWPPSPLCAWIKIKITAIQEGQIAHYEVHGAIFLWPQQRLWSRGSDFCGG